MPVAIVTRMPAAFDTDTYDAVHSKVEIEANPPSGLIFHALAKSDDGYMIVDFWESEQAFDDFRTGRLNPALEAVVGSEAFAAMPTPERKVHEVHNVVRP